MWIYAFLRMLLSLILLLVLSSAIFFSLSASFPISLFVLVCYLLDNSISEVQGDVCVSGLWTGQIAHNITFVVATLVSL